MRTCFTLLLFSLFTTLFAQTPDYVFPKDYYDDFVSADFDAATGNGFALGQCGILLRTADFGGSWSQVAGDRFANGGTNLVVSCVPGTQCQTAIVVAGSGLSRTTDFGANWSGFTSNFATQILHLSDGTILGFQKNSSEAITSSNQGQSWTTVNLPAESILDAVAMPDGDVFFFDDNKNLYRSTDQGTTYSNVFTSENFPRRLAVDGNDLLISDNRNSMFRSTDKGATWTTLTTSLPVGGSIREIWRGADGNLHIMNFLGASGTSTDNGATWSLTTVAGFSLSSITIKDGKILAAGRRLGLWTSEDDWSTYDYTLGEEQYYIAGISFGERNHGFAIAADGHFFRTTDGGENWNRTGHAGFSTGRFIHAYDRDKVIVHTSGAGLSFTINGGNSFSNLGQELDLGITSTTALNLFPNGDIAIMTGTRFHVVSPQGMLNSTLDITVPVTMPSSSKLTIISPTTGFLTGGGGKMWRTADSGASWTMVLDGGITNQPYRDIYFVDDQLGFSGDQNISIRTTDGGLTWEVYRDLPGGYNFVKTRNGAILKMASGNRIFESADNGTSWREATSLPCGTASFLALRPSSGKSFVSLGSTIARLDVDFTDAVRSPVINDPDFQVFPNPTTGLLSLDIPSLAGKEATVQVTDLAGRMVFGEELRRQARAQLDLSKLKTGIYVVSIYAADGVRTRRVMVK